ncbi:MAG: 3-deoxy-7-phosphoheptulonate synthase class II [Sphingomonadales bacterium]|nr:3-deoxy-7-phosphoheptulonate synthase class II [Sphingomonadales bacterium]
MSERWTPDSWQRHEARQLPDYPDTEALADATRELGTLPPLVFAGEARDLQRRIADVAAGRAFLLQGGDCAETFADFDPDAIRDSFRVILQMAAVLTYASKLPIVKMGRMAGQFAKPRSQATETQGDLTLPVWRGDSVNGIAFTEQARRHDPARMLRAYGQSAATINHLRAMSSGGYANLREVQSWTHAFMAESPWAERYRAVADRIGDALDFMEACGVGPHNQPGLQTVQFFTGHEALLLPYEQALTRIDPASGKHYATSAHFLWVGDRTRFAGSAHVEFLRGIANPLGMKCGPGLEPDALLTLLDTLNPAREAGRITLITRLGSDAIGRRLPQLIRAVEREGHPVAWCCDAMHANVVRTAAGIKTRPFDRILSEARDYFAIHRAEGSFPGGIHVEMTGQDVTECTGGAVAITADALSDRYRTYCDPRLNAAQSLELAFLVGEMLDREMRTRASEAA